MTIIGKIVICGLITGVLSYILYQQTKFENETETLNLYKDEIPEKEELVPLKKKRRNAIQYSQLGIIYDGEGIISIPEEDEESDLDLD